MYGMTLSGKYWYLDLLDFLLSLRFKASKNVPCLFMLVTTKGKIYPLNYVDDMFYFGTDQAQMEWFENSLKQRLNLEILGHAHWYLATRINQLSNFDIVLDQCRYCLAIFKKYLDVAGAKKITTLYMTPVPSDFIPTADDCSDNEETSQRLQIEYNIDFASCIGSLIYLGMTRTDIIYSVNKLAKFTRQPGKAHFNALLQLLRYLMDNTYLGIRFYSNFIDPSSTCYNWTLFNNIILFLDFLIPHGMTMLILVEVQDASL